MMIYHKMSEVKSDDTCTCDRCEKCGKLIEPLVQPTVVPYYPYFVYPYWSIYPNNMPYYPYTITYSTGNTTDYSIWNGKNTLSW